MVGEVSRVKARTGSQKAQGGYDKERKGGASE